MRDFVSEIFQLKPYLMTSFSLNNFRVVIEVMEGNQSSLTGLITIVNQFYEAACRVPIMIF